MNSKTKISTLGIILIFFSGIALSLNASLVDGNDVPGDLIFDRVDNQSEPFNNVLTSFSYTDNSLRNPNMHLELCGDNETLGGERAQLFYASESGNLTTSLLAEEATISNFTGDCTTLDIDISAFNATFPAQPRVGLINETEIEITENVTYENEDNETVTEEQVVDTETVIGPPKNITELDELMLGNYSIGVTIRSVEDQTGLEVVEVLNEEEELIHESPIFTRDMLHMSITDGDEIIEERITNVFDREIFDFRFEGGENVYVNGILALETKAVNGCQSLNESNSYYIINETTPNNQESCITMDNMENSVLDFANQTIDGDNNESKQPGKCAITINNSNSVSIDSPKVQQYDRGICVYNSQEINIGGVSSSQENNDGVYSENSTINVSQITLNNEDSELRALNNTEMNLNKVDFDTANVSGTIRDVTARNVYDEPENPTDDLETLGQYVNISNPTGNGEIDDFGFDYAPISETNVNPLFIYKFEREETQVDENTTGTFWVDEQLPSSVLPAERFIFSPGVIDEFSVFGVYGEVVEGEGPGEDEGEGSDEADEGTDQEGGDGGPGTGLDPDPTPEPEPTPIQLDLELEDDVLEIQQGGTEFVNFTVENVGNVESEEVFVDALVDTGWQSGRADFENIIPGNTVTGSLLIEVWENEIVGERNVPINVNSFAESVLDSEILTVEVLPRQELDSIDVVEGPSFLELEEGTTQEVGFLLENTGDFDYEEVTLDVRNAGNCIEGTSGSYSLDSGEQETLLFEVDVVRGEGFCNGVFVIDTERSEAVGFSPSQIEVVERTLLDRITTGALPIIVLLWTILTVYRVRQKIQ